MRKATELLTELKNRMSVIEDELQETFPPIVTERWSEKTGKRLKDNVEVFNVGSRQQVAKRLESLGVKWKRVTETGRPVVDEGTLSEIDLPEAKLVAEFLMLQKRVGLVSSWLDAADVKGFVHGRVISNGAVTGRMTHSSPNMGQIPSVSSEYGVECRSCWTVPEGYNGGGAKEGEQILENFYANTPALRQLQARVGRLAQNGTIKGLDGRRLHIRSERAVLNTLLQSCGAIIAKQWCVEIHKELLRQGLTAHVMQCAFVHDEIQMAVKEKYCEIVAKIMVDSAAKAGVELDFRVKVDAEAKTGSHWADTH
jgi:DNA polymerase I-like protein with 3'-5' exonuclease and polymerase domains